MKDITHDRYLFSTERLAVRDLVVDDIEEYHLMQNDEDVMKYTTGRAMSYQENKDDLDRVIGYYSKPKNDFWVWAIEQKVSKEFVGTCAVVISEGEQFEIGFRFLKKYWGNGFGSEIITPLLSYCYKKTKQERLIAYVDQRNLASIKILEKGNPVSRITELNPDTGLPDYKFEFLKH